MGSRLLRAALPLWIGFVGLLASLPAPAQTAAPATPPPSVESFFRNPQLSRLALSPSGKLIAMLVPGRSGRLMLGVIDTETLSSARAVVGFEDADVRNFHWVNDTRLVFDTIDFESAGGDQKPPGLFAVNVDGTDLRQLVRSQYRAKPTIGTRITTRDLAWNHSFHSTLNDGSANIVIQRWNWRGTGEFDQATLLRLDTETGITTPIGGDAPGGARYWLVDAKGEPSVVWTVIDSRTRLYSRNAQSGAWDLVADDPNGFVELTMRPYQVDDAGTLYVRAPGKSADGTEGLYRYRLAEGKLEAEPLVSLPGFDFNGELVFDAARTRLLGIHYLSDARGTFWFDPQMRSVQERVDKLLPTTNNRLSCRRCGESRHVLVESRSDRQAALYWLYNTESKVLQSVGASRPWADAKLMGKRTFERIAARDGLSIPVYITHPRTGKGPWPAVVLVHGGPWSRGGQWEWDDEAQFLASRGYLVIEPEFRGSAGFGTKHYRAGFKQWGLAMQDDLADAALWAVNKGLADKQRMCIAGGDYGGYAAMMGLLKHPELYRCGINWLGVTDIGLMYSIDWSDYTDVWKREGMPTLIGDRIKDAAQLEATSPLHQAAHIRQPILMAYGGKDRWVPLAHGNRFRDAVSKTNLNVEWVVYGEEGHGFLLLASRVDFWTRVEKFLARHLQTPN